MNLWRVHFRLLKRAEHNVSDQRLRSFIQFEYVLAVKVKLAWLVTQHTELYIFGSSSWENYKVYVSLCMQPKPVQMLKFTEPRCGAQSFSLKALTLISGLFGIKAFKMDGTLLSWFCPMECQTLLKSTSSLTFSMGTSNHLSNGIFGCGSKHLETSMTSPNVHFIRNCGKLQKTLRTCFGVTIIMKCLPWTLIPASSILMHLFSLMANLNGGWMTSRLR